MRLSPIFFFKKKKTSSRLINWTFTREQENVIHVQKCKFQRVPGVHWRRQQQTLNWEHRSRILRYGWLWTQQTLRLMRYCSTVDRTVLTSIFKVAIIVGKYIHQLAYGMCTTPFHPCYWQRLRLRSGLSRERLKLEMGGKITSSYSCSSKGGLVNERASSLVSFKRKTSWARTVLLTRYSNGRVLEAWTTQNMRR